MDDQDNKTGSGVQSPAPVAGRPLTAEDVAELKRLAEAATPGPWKACGTIYEHMNCEVRSGRKGEGQAIAQVWDGPNAFKDGQWIAAASPAAFLALIAENERLSRPASDQPVEAIGAGREVARMREIAISWRHPSLRQIEGPNDLKIYGGTIADDIDRWADMIAALSPAFPARTPMGEPVAWIERQNDGTRYGEPKRWPPSDRARSYAQEMGRTIEPLYAAASPARTPMGEPQVLKGVGKINGDGWKDTTTIGEVVYVWNAEKPSPYAPGQYPRIDNEGWSASTAQYDFSPASVDEVRALAAPTPMGGDREHSSRCWGRTSFSDEVLHCYCQTAPTPMGGEVEALREALEPFAAVADEYDDREDDTFEVWMDAGPVMVRDIRKALRLSAFRRARQALAPSSPSPAQGGDAEDEDDPELPDTSLARTIYKHFCDVHMLNPDEAADATGELLAAIAAPDEAMCSEHRPAADEDQVREWALIGLYLVEGRTTTDSESSMSIEWALGDRAALLADAEGWALEDAREDYNRIFCDRTNALSASPQPEAGEEDPSHHQVWTQERGWEHPTPPSVQPVEGK